MNIGGLFANACDFAQASNTMRGKQTLLVPYVVNGAFACELYIKGLLLLQGYTLQQLKSLPSNQKHNLSALYDLLDSGVQDELRNAVMQKFTNPNGDFESYLLMIANAFMDWRYGYESQSVSVESVDNETGAITFSVVLSGKGINLEFFEIFISCLHDLSDRKIGENMNSSK